MCFLDKWFAPAPQFVRKPKQPKRGNGKPKPTGTHTFTVQKAYCCPAEPLIRNALEPFGVPISNYSEQAVKVSMLASARIKHKEPDYAHLPVAQQATFSVRKGQAEWAESLLWATGRLIVVGGNINKRNEAWGKQRNGAMPIAWDAHAGRMYARSKAPATQNDTDTPYAAPPPGEPWIEPGCSKALEVWSKTNKLVKDKKTKEKRK